MLWHEPRRTPPAVRPQAQAAADARGRAAILKLKMKVHRNVVTALETERIKVSDDAAVNQETRKRVDGIINGLLQKETATPLTREQRVKFINELLDEILGLGPLEELMRDPSVTEIMVNAFDKVYIEKAGKLILTKYKFRSNEQIMQVMKRIVAPLGRRIDESVPLVDARLKDGSRVNGIIPPLAVSGPTLTIRRFSAKPYRRGAREKRQRLAAGVDFLKACVKLRKDIIIAGGTAPVKPLPDMLSSYVPKTAHRDHRGHRRTRRSGPLVNKAARRR